MNTTCLARYAGALLALAICTACGGAVPFDSAQGRPAQGDMRAAPSTAALNYPYLGARLSPMPRYAMMVPDRRAKSKDFEYIINDYGTNASIFDYPKSVKQIGTINNVGGQGCTNVPYGYGKKIIWIVAGSDQIEEFKVPDKSIKTLSVGNSFPTSCAMNAGGDLAVGIYDGSTYPGGDVVIFKSASGSGTPYATPLDEEFFDGFDSQGNLFADGFTGYRSGFALVELPNGSTKFVAIKTSNSVQFPGSVQWDGTYVTVFDQLSNAVYQYTISGTKATLKGTVKLTGASDCAQTWIVKGLLYCGDAGNDQGEVFKYPAGGSPVAVLTGSFDFPLGVVAAKK
ncbi:MAG: hypothetical protein WBW76_03040 [Candidatus Cybelea sp.]